jgi:hypothetical protein
VSADPSQAEQEQKQDKDSEKSDDEGTAAALGLINTGPVQLKTDLEQPVTSGGMTTTNLDPGSPD